MSRLDKFVSACVVTVGLAVAIAYGGSKSHDVPNAGADAGIALVGITAEYDSTNDVTGVEVKFTAGLVTVATPVSVRNSDREQWRELVKIGATVTSDLPTNILSFAVAGNAATNRFWWVGVDTPAVIVESEGIEITYFLATAHTVTIEWRCDDPRATRFTVQRRRNGADHWESVGETDDAAFVFYGFTVGETWGWRVSATYAEEVE